MNLYQLLPELYRRADAEAGELSLKRFLEAIGEALEETREAVEALPDLVNLEEVSADRLPHLLANQANPFDISFLDEKGRRDLGRQLRALYRKKGTLPGIQAAARAVLGLNVMVLSWWTDTSARFLGAGEDGGTVAPSDLLPPCRTAFEGPYGREEPGAWLSIEETSHEAGTVLQGALSGTLHVTHSAERPAALVCEYSLDTGFTWRACHEMAFAPEALPPAAGPIVALAPYPEEAAVLPFSWDTAAEGIATGEGHPGVLLRFTVREEATGILGSGAVLRWLPVNNSGGDTVAPLVRLRADKPFIVADHAARAWILGETTFGELVEDAAAEQHRRRGVYHFEVIVLDEGLDEAGEAALRRIVDFMKPAGLHYEITALPEREEVVTGWVLGVSKLGQNTILTG